MNFSHTLTTSKPRFVLIAIAVVMAFAAISIASSEAHAGSGGVGAGGTSSGGGNGDAKSSAKQPTANASKYNRLWNRVSVRDKRWAHSTSQCESGGDPDAIGGGGAYRGAFQFMKATWRTSPKSPGGDPIDYTYKTQAVVAVALKKQDGAGHWPVCG